MSYLNHLVYPKQIASFELYDRIGSDFLSIPIKTANKDRLRIEKTWYTLIQKREILRSLLIYENDRLYRRELPLDKEQFKLEIKPVSDENEFNKMNALRLEILNKSSLNNNKLFYGTAYEFKDYYTIILYINHVICNTAALALLKENFITLYNDNEAIIQPNQYNDYIEDHILKSRNRFLAEYDFHKNRLNGIMPGQLIQESDLAVNLNSNTEYIDSITVKTFNHRKILKPAAENKPEKAVFCYLISHFKVQKYANFKYYKYSLYTLIIAAYVKAMNDLYAKEFYFQFIMDYKNNKYTLNQIGDFSADFHMPCIPYDLNATAFLQQVQLELFKTYRARAIYNYQMFDIDVSALFANCNMLINYTPLNTSFEFDPQDESGEFCCDNNRAHHANFELSVDNKGLIHYKITFKEEVHSKDFILEFDQLWKLNMKNFLAIL